MTQTLEYDSTREKSWNRFSIIMFAVSCIFCRIGIRCDSVWVEYVGRLALYPTPNRSMLRIHLWTMSFGVSLVGIITGLGASLRSRSLRLLSLDGGRVFLFDALFRLSLVRHLLMVVMKELSNAVAAILVEADADIAARRRFAGLRGGVAVLRSGGIGCM